VLASVRHALLDWRGQRRFPGADILKQHAAVIEILLGQAVAGGRRYLDGLAVEADRIARHVAAREVDRDVHTAQCRLRVIVVRGSYGHGRQGHARELGDLADGRNVVAASFGGPDRHASDH